MDFIALDFETANWYRSSACSIGMVKVEDGQIIDTFYSLIKPEPFWFHHVNVNIHGITEDDCINAPTFSELWPQIQNWLEGKIIVAHNVSFERSVLNHLAIEYGIIFNVSEYLCSLYLSRVAFPKLDNYKLPNVYFNVFGRQFESHHNALDDAKASAEIVMKVFEKWQPPTFRGMIGALYEEPVGSRVDPKRKVSLASLTPDEGMDENVQLKGKMFVFTGELNSFTKEEAAQFIVNKGGKASDNVTMATTHLVVGRYNSSYGADYKSGKVKKAETLIEKGQQISFLTEQDFLEITRH